MANTNNRNPSQQNPGRGQGDRQNMGGQQRQDMGGQQRDKGSEGSNQDQQRQQQGMGRNEQGGEEEE